MRSSPKLALCPAAEVVLDLLDDARGHASDHREGRHIAGHDGPCHHHGDALAVSAALGPADVAVVSYSGALLDQLTEEIGVLRRRGCRMVVVSADDAIPGRLAGLKCFLPLPAGEPKGAKIATFYEQECVRYVLNCVYAECFSQSYRDNVRRMAAYEEHRTPPYRRSP